jgi:hypothetical protein
MNRKDFFKTLFGGFVAASTTPSLAKSEENPQPPKDLALGREVLRVDERGSVGIGGGSGYLGLGTNTPTQALHVSGIIFHINDRKLEMSGDENGNFKIKWLDVKKDECNPAIIIEQPKVDPWKTSLNQIR